MLSLKRRQHGHTQTHRLAVDSTWLKLIWPKEEGSQNSCCKSSSSSNIRHTWRHNFCWRIQSCPRVDHQPTKVARTEKKMKAFWPSNFQAVCWVFNYTKQTYTAHVFQLLIVKFRLKCRYQFIKRLRSRLPVPFWPTSCASRPAGVLQPLLVPLSRCSSSS